MLYSAETFYNTWSFLENHPAFKKQVGKDWFEQAFKEALSIHVTKVNPETNEVDDDMAKNSKVAVWLECGKWLKAEEVMPKHSLESTPEDFYGAFCHDVNLDCGGDTFEQAIIRLGYLVAKEYGYYENKD